MCRLIVLAFAGGYALALAWLAVSWLSILGQQPDPLAGVLVLLLGMPWNRLIDLAPPPLWPWLAAAAPAANLSILAAVCRGIAARRSSLTAIAVAASLAPAPTVRAEADGPDFFAVTSVAACRSRRSALRSGRPLHREGVVGP